MRASAIVLLLFWVAPGAWADEGKTLSENGRPRALQDGLEERADGTTWIRRRDMTGALDIVVRELIPSPEAPRRRARRAKRTFLLCRDGFCAAVPAARVDTSSPGNETFPLKTVATGLGWRLEGNEAGYELIPLDKAPRRRNKLGHRIEPFVLPTLDGRAYDVDTGLGKPTLIVLWSSWSASRTELATWAAEWKRLRGRGLDLLTVAADLEGPDRVRSYVPPGLVPHTVIDREGVLAGLWARRATGGFVLIDDLGVIRAIGNEPSVATLRWIGRHLEEPRAGAAPVPPRRAEQPALEVLRADVASHPKNVKARVRLARHLEATGDATGAAEQVAHAWAVEDRKNGSLTRWLARLHLDAGDRAAALTVLDDARRADPSDRSLRVQRLALLHPARFYAGPIDAPWVAAELKREDERLGRRKKK